MPMTNNALPSFLSTATSNFFSYRGTLTSRDRGLPCDLWNHHACHDHDHDHDLPCHCPCGLWIHRAFLDHDLHHQNRPRMNLFLRLATVIALRLATVISCIL